MTQRQAIRRRPTPSGRVLGALAGVLLLAGACSPAAPLGTPTPATSSASAATPPIAAESAEQPSQTDTDWGRIWDRLPAAFPHYPGAVPSDEAQTEPVSGTFTLGAGEARAVAAWMQAELEQDAYRTEALNGPMEDGGFILDSTGPDGCRIQVAVRPLGATTLVTVRYGADCPSP